MQNNFPYIEPTIRTIAGTLLTLSGLIIYFFSEHTGIALALLFFVSLNLAQSGFTRFCLMEKILKKFGFRSELEEIRDLNLAMAISEAEALSNIETLNMLNEVVIGITPQLNLSHVSKPIESLLGNAHLVDTFIGKPIAEIVFPADRVLVHDALSKILFDATGTWTLRFRLARGGIDEFWVEGKFFRREENGRATEIRGILRDITEPYLQEQRIVHMALHDALTGLPNRALLEDRMLQAVLDAEREGTKTAVIFVDLDNFKQVNDIYGHKAGDQLLVEVTKALKANLRQCDTVARWGGDEFIILLSRVNGLEDVRKMAGSLANAVGAHLLKNHPDYHVTLSLGGSIYPDDAKTPENLLIQADKALFFAKSQGRNNAKLFGEISKSELGYKDVDFTSDFSAAIRNELIQVYYQPIVDAHTHLPIGMEALARWHDEKYGWVSPTTFIPLAETLGSIEKLGHQVLEQALRQFAQCDTSMASGMFISINISNRQLVSNTFVADLIECVNRHAVNPKKIKLEITESVAVLGIDRAHELLSRLASAGFTLSLDDFGTGYSSLSYLHALPVDEIKIDASFVRRIQTDAGRVMVEAITHLGHALNMNVVAEGVESKECADILSGMGIDMLQGNYFRQASPKDECMSYIAACSKNAEAARAA